jgi:PAS domain S-box-containing protein
MGEDVVVGLEHFEGNGGAERMKDRGAALLERSTNPILMIRLSDGLVVETNEALFMMTGFNRRELLGRSAQELVIPVRPPSPAVALHVLDSLGSVADIPAGFRTRSGELRVAHLSAQAIEIDGQLEALCTIRDSRDPTSAERRAAAGEEVARILTGTASPEPARAALQAIGECLRWDLGALWHVDPLTEHLSCEAAWRWPLADLAALEKSRWRGTVSPGNGLPARVWKASQATWITDLAEEGGAGQGAAGDDGTDHESVHGWFGFPVVAGDEVVGVVEFFSREARQLDSELVQMATRLGRLFGRLLGGAVQEQQVEQEQGSGQEGAAEQDWSLDAAASAPPNADQLLLRELVARVARVNEMLEAIVGPDPTDPETTAPPAVATGERTAAPRSRSGRALTLKVLSELTGVPPGTLRTWERRYGFTHPSRSAAGYRQYGEADVSRVLQIKQLRERGVRIGEAIQVVSESVSDIVPENPPTVGDPAPPPPTEPGPHR